LSVDQRILKQMLAYAPAAEAKPKPGSVGGGYPRNPRDWIYKFATPTVQKQQVVMFEIDLSIRGLKIMQLRDNTNRYKVLWKMPFTANDRWSRQTAMDYGARYAQQQGWQIVPYAISSFVGSL